jgi:hypothetical protein
MQYGKTSIPSISARLIEYACFPDSRLPGHEQERCSLSGDVTLQKREVLPAAHKRRNGQRIRLGTVRADREDR